MLETIETRLQAILDTLNTDLKKVRVFDINGLERADKNIYDHEVVTVVYRENPSPLPDIGGADRIIQASLQVLALESEKSIVQALFNEFFEDNNNTLIDDRWVTFTNITAIGLADNSGAKVFQRWEVGMTILVIDNISNIKDITVSINNNDITIYNGLVSYKFRRIGTFDENPTSLYNALDERRKDYELSLIVLDVDDTTGFLKTILYDGNSSVSLSITDGTYSISFNGKITQIDKDAQVRTFSTISLTIKRG